MEMESSRRSMDRSRESGVVKKPRLGEDGDGDRRVDGDRVFPRSLASRLRASERGRDGGREEPTRGGDYQQQQQEIIGQYKGALSELTFNSKPIITNLTIIAGENLHAAKGIAATICANILEVPSEQKLPSLYLLDSIVKNIGSDYIKYFAARLPEVFCKAYRQVDSSVLAAMKHLFGTWKGVFPPSSLQIIEKELGFQPIINSSSSVASNARSDSQTQRPTHSIHVNPKYLARHLQQSSRAKEGGGDSGNAVASSDVERPNRVSIIESTRPRAEFLAKMPIILRPQREKLNGPSHEKNLTAKYEDYEFVPDRPQNGNVRIAEQSELDTPCYGVGGNAVDATSGQRNALEVPNAYKSYRVPRPAQTVTKLNPTQEMGSRNTRDTLGSWKNSEEEEYMWDVNSRLKNQGGTDSSSKDGLDRDSSKKLESVPRGKWMPLETEHLDTRWSMSNSFPRLDKPSRGEDRVPFQREVEYLLPKPRDLEDIRSRFSRETSADSLSRVGGQATFGHRTPSVWPNQERLSMDGLNHKNVGSVIVGQTDGLSNVLSGELSTTSNSSLTRTGLQLHTGDPSVGVVPSNFGPMANVVSVSSGMSHQRQQPITVASSASSASSPGHQHPQSPLSAPHQYKQPQTSTNHIHLQLQSSQPGQRPSQLSEQLNQAPNLQTTQDSSAVLPQNHMQSGLFRNLSVSSQPPQHLERSSPSLPSFTPLRHTLPFSQQSQSELPLQQTRPQSSFQTQKSSQPSSFVAPQTTTAYSGLGHTEIPVADILGHSCTSNLLAAIMKSGLITTDNPVTGNFPNPSLPDSLTQSNLNAQPPLPSGPPPIQLTSSSMPMVPPASALSPASHGKESIPTNALKVIPPPLPPGPPPQSSLVGTSSQGPSTANTIPNPLSSLLSSLVAKGLIATPQKESTTFNAPQMPIDSSLPVSTSSFSSSIPTSSSDKESIANDISLSQSPVLGPKGLLGIEFKPEIIRKEHTLVICSLFDDLPHQCSICGLRFKLQEQISGHMEWHGSKKLEQDGCDVFSRKWFIGLSSWVAGHLEPSTGPIYVTCIEEAVMTAETSEPVVPADESQIICALCGEPFEDFYSEETDEWMYKGAVYMTLPVEGNVRTTDDSTMQGPIVHANCVSTIKKDG